MADRINYEYFGKIDKLDNYFWNVGKNELLIGLMKQDAPFSRVLNMGSGMGDKMLSALGNIISMDIDLYSVNHTGKYSKAVLGDGQNIAFKNNTFDCVIASEVLEHIEDDYNAVNEILRITKPGGLIVITVPAIKFIFSTHDLALGHHKRYSRKELLDLCKELQIVRSEYWCFISFLLVTPFRLIKKFLRRPMKHDPLIIPDIMNKIFLSLLRIENKIITRGHSMPIGLTLVLMGRKKKR